MEIVRRDRTGADTSTTTRSRVVVWGFYRAQTPKSKLLGFNRPPNTHTGLPLCPNKRWCGGFDRGGVVYDPHSGVDVRWGRRDLVPDFPQPTARLGAAAVVCMLHVVYTSGRSPLPGELALAIVIPQCSS